MCAEPARAAAGVAVAAFIFLAVPLSASGAGGNGSADGVSMVARFAKAIDAGRAVEAVSMLGEGLAPDEAGRRAWLEQFSAFESMAVIDIRKLEEGAPECERFRVSFSVTMKPESANAVIPFFGWDSNPAIRWMTLCREEGEWRVTAIDTGP